MASYKVTDVTEITRFTRAGREERIYRVYLVTARGASGFVDVPAASWNEDEVAAILEQKANDLDLAFRVAEQKE